MKVLAETGYRRVMPKESIVFPKNTRKKNNVNIPARTH